MTPVILDIIVTPSHIVFRVKLRTKLEDTTMPKSRDSLTMCGIYAVNLLLWPRKASGMCSYEEERGFPTGKLCTGHFASFIVLICFSIASILILLLQGLYPWIIVLLSCSLVLHCLLGLSLWLQVKHRCKWPNYLNDNLYFWSIL